MGKLTEEDKVKIAELKAYGIGESEIGKQFGVSQQAINQLIKKDENVQQIVEEQKKALAKYAPQIKDNILIAIKAYKDLMEEEDPSSAKVASATKINIKAAESLGIFSTNLQPIIINNNTQITPVMVKVFEAIGEKLTKFEVPSDAVIVNVE